MAIESDFLESNRPYVHSTLYFFRADIEGIATNGTISEGLDTTIQNLEKISQQLKNEADTFLMGRSYQDVSKELFFTENTFKGIAMEVVRNPDFMNDILGNAKFDVNNQIFQQFFGNVSDDMMNDLFSSKSFEEITDKIVNRIFQDSKNDRVRIDDNFIFKELFKNAKSERVFATNTENFRKEVRKMLKRISPINYDGIWQAFKRRFLDIAKNKLQYQGINSSTDRFMEDWINDDSTGAIGDFKKAFYTAMEGGKVKLRDPSNIQGWLGEDFKNAIWSSTSMSFNFIQTSEMTEQEIFDKVKNDWGKEIQTMHISSSNAKSHSDWILKNRDGYIVRAQDKNSSTFIQKLKEGQNYPQPIKLQDTIAYLTLKSNLQNYGYNELTGEEWDILDYLVANTVWFSRVEEGGTKVAHREGSTASNYATNLSGVREVINRILAEEIGYFAGIEAKQLDDGLMALGSGGNNTFFVIDNTILFPTYLMINYIIRQLKNESDQLNRIQVTFDSSFTPLYTARALAEEKLRKGQEDNPDWQPQSPYGEGVLNIGKEQGASILNTLKVNRVNLRFDLKTILTSAYNFTSSDIQNLY